MVHVFNIRNFSYKTTKDYEPDYYDKTFDAGTIKKVNYVIEPFGILPGQAHVLLSFEFENETFLAISVEIRKKKGDEFYAYSCLYKNFELMYVIGSEEDLIQLRTTHRGDRVYMYSLNLSKEKAKELFLDMVYRANKLKDEPEFFKLLSNSCVSNVVTHINKVAPNSLPFIRTTLAPKKSDKVLHRRGLIDNSRPFEEVREKHYISGHARDVEDSSHFSKKIRRGR
jgi:hypothetical protein